MSEIVLGIGASHTTLMNTQWEKVAHIERAQQFRSGLNSARIALQQAEPDLVVIIGSNHFRGFWLDLMPSFTIGVGAVLSSGEHGMPKGSLVADGSFGAQICEHLLGEGFDPAFSTSLTVDHGISHAVQWIVGEQGIPIVPIVVNAFAPPLPRLTRVREFGEALRKAIIGIKSARRVAVIATGGLSHCLPFPDWRAPESEDDRFLADSFHNGRGRWEVYEGRRRSIVVNAPSKINEDFDRSFLQLLADGELRRFPDICDDSQLVRVAGNGANELRAWLMMGAACGYIPGKVEVYAPMPEWLTGMAIAILRPKQ
jgi:2,3-dihydroxyphenylpropionate 1,2-dioxygenase